MPNDPTGTTPGLAGQTEPEPETVNMKCKNQSCDSITAIEIKHPGSPGMRMYRCTKCHATRGINVGGSVDF
jgi:hypothetical protein